LTSTPTWCVADEVHQLVLVLFLRQGTGKENAMQPSATTIKLTNYATRFSRLDAIALAKLTGEPPKSVREVLAHLGRY